ncbi:MAG: NRDE family protein [Gammaproteobacteria bacterium]|jgi:uncharacterized protein with NRDE domain
MCIVAIGHRVSSRYPLIVAANRDERYARPAAAADWWAGTGSLLAGRDLEAGGTWLGVTGSGRFAAVTNVFEGGRGRPAERSRGALVTGFLEGSETPSAYAAGVGLDRYGPFNLVLGDAAELFFLSNRNASKELGFGVHVFSNNAPGLQWTKVAVLEQAMAGAADGDDPAQCLIGTLSGPGASGPPERAAESMFVVGSEFGTRCTTVLTVGVDNRAKFVEQRFDPGGMPAGWSEFEFEISPQAC